MYKNGKLYVYTTTRHGRFLWNYYGVTKQVAEMFAREFSTNPEVLRVEVVRER